VCGLAMTATILALMVHLGVVPVGEAQ
jgi:hypothetical protein